MGLAGNLIRWRCGLSAAERTGYGAAPIGAALI